jgi:hypothetical protein
MIAQTQWLKKKMNYMNVTAAPECSVLCPQFSI